MDVIWMDGAREEQWGPQEPARSRSQYYFLFSASNFSYLLQGRCRAGWGLLLWLSHVSENFPEAQAFPCLWLPYWPFSILLTNNFIFIWSSLLFPVSGSFDLSCQPALLAAFCVFPWYMWKPLHPVPVSQELKAEEGSRQLAAGLLTWRQHTSSSPGMATPELIWGQPVKSPHYLRQKWS